MATLTTLQTDITRLYEGKQTAPDTTSKKWSVRTGLINLAIRRWENTEGYQWDELWTTLDDAADGDKTIATSDKTYAAPTDFRRMGGYVELWDGTDLKERIKVLKPNQLQNQSDSKQYAFVTGNKSAGFTVNLAVAPVAEQNGYTIKYNYYKYATELSAGGDTAEMADPDYIVFSAVSELYKGDQLQANASRYERQARDILLQMEQRQFAEYEYQPSQFEDQGSSGFGV